VTVAVFDCNIFLQALLNPESIASKCLDLVKSGNVFLFVSEESLTEVREVFFRPNILAKLPDANEEQIAGFIDEIIRISTFVDDVPKNFTFKRDPKDEMIMDLALICEADYVVSRDKDLLDLMTDFDDTSKEFRQRFRPMKVVEPLEFLRIVEAKLKEDMSINP
jgi:putative PIN family toxin of toxin-antitoxin system